MEESIQRLTFAHLFWWALAVLAGAAGGWVGQKRLTTFLCIIASFCIAPFVLLFAVKTGSSIVDSNKEPARNFQIERQVLAKDGTIIYVLTFDFQQGKNLAVGLYDCDSDDANPYYDSNTSYMVSRRSSPSFPARRRRCIARYSARSTGASLARPACRSPITKNRL